MWCVRKHHLFLKVLYVLKRGWNKSRNVGDWKNHLTVNVSGGLQYPALSRIRKRISVPNVVLVSAVFGLHTSRGWERGVQNKCDVCRTGTQTECRHKDKSKTEYVKTNDTDSRRLKHTTPTHKGWIFILEGRSHICGVCWPFIPLSVPPF